MKPHNEDQAMLADARTRRPDIARLADLAAEFTLSHRRRQCAELRDRTSIERSGNLSSAVPGTEAK